MGLVPKEKSVEMKPRRLNKLLSLFSVILIGAIGSGFWDFFLRDMIYYLGGIFVHFMNFIFAGYTDRLFENVGKQINGLILIPSIFIVTLIIMLPLIMYLLARILRYKIVDSVNTLSENNTEKTVIENVPIERFMLWIGAIAIKRRRLYMIIMLMPSIISSIVYTDVLVTEVTNSSAVTQMDRWLDILRPDINENEYYRLISEFRLVDDRKSYQDLVDKVQNYAINVSVKLPELAIYGIETK